jgi:hypothetical protein
VRLRQLVVAHGINQKPTSRIALYAKQDAERNNIPFDHAKCQ